MDDIPAFTGYDSVRFHARGGSAVVWRARQISLDREVAIKELLPELCGGDDSVARFLAEARVLARMAHPNIVRCIDAFQHGGRLCFVMEFIEAGTIAELCGSLGERECLAIANVVASALDYAWTRHGTIHCDIKPANIMIASDGVVKITDFGISQSLSTSTLNAESGEIEIFGTPYYMSPEQVSGSQELGIQTDMYSLGATLYYCVSGRKLFHDLDSDSAMDAQVAGRCPDLADLVPSLSLPFCAFIEKLLAKSPSSRYANWGEISAEIRSILSGRTLIHGELDPRHAISTIERGAARPAPPSFPPATFSRNIFGKFASRLRNHRQTP